MPPAIAGTRSVSGCTCSGILTAAGGPCQTGPAVEVPRRPRRLRSITRTNRPPTIATTTPTPRITQGSQAMKEEQIWRALADEPLSDTADATAAASVRRTSQRG